MQTPQPFRVDVPQADLDDLPTGWPVPAGPTSCPAPAGRTASRSTAYGSWPTTGATGYDWRAHEARLNAFPQFTTEIDGQNIHFLHVRSPEPGRAAADHHARLAELGRGVPRDHRPADRPGRARRRPGRRVPRGAPSLPGFAFSGPTPDRLGTCRHRAGLGGADAPPRVRALRRAGRRLGLDRHAGAGPGRARTGRRRARQRLRRRLPTGLRRARPRPERRARLGSMARWRNERIGYASIQSTRPQTLAYALVDSPVGQLAWNLEWFDD